MAFKYHIFVITGAGHLERPQYPDGGGLFSNEGYNHLSDCDVAFNRAVKGMPDDCKMNEYIALPVLKVNE